MRFERLRASSVCVVKTTTVKKGVGTSAVGMSKCHGWWQGKQDVAPAPVRLLARIIALDAR